MAERLEEKMANRIYNDYLDKVLDDYHHCKDKPECEKCFAFNGMMFIPTGAGECYNFCEFLRKHGNYAKDKINEAIESSL